MLSLAPSSSATNKKPTKHIVKGISTMAKRFGWSTQFMGSCLFVVVLGTLAVGSDGVSSDSSSSSTSSSATSSNRTVRKKETCVYNDRIGQSFSSCVGVDRGNEFAVKACCDRLDLNREMFFGDSADTITSIGMTSDGRCELCAR